MCFTWNLLLEKALEVEPDRVAVVVGVHEDVGGERRETRRQLPDVEVVDVDDVRVRRERGADHLGVQVGRGRFEEHPARFAEQPHPRVHHERRDHHRGDRVGAFEAGGDDHDAGDQGADECVEVGEDVAKARLDVEAAPARARELIGDGEVDHDADKRR